MSGPYWMYESALNDCTCVSIRANKLVKLHDYYQYLGNFISTYSDRIIESRETSRLLDDCTCVSIRANKLVKLHDYYQYLGNFISTYSDRIIESRETSRLLDGSLVTIVKLKEKDYIYFKNGQNLVR